MNGAPETGVDTVATAASSELDLTGEGEVESSPISPTERPWSPEPRRESVRGWLAIGLSCLLAGTVAAAFVCEAANWLTRAEIDGLLSPIFPSLVALTGTAIGFYFGGRG